MIEAKCGCGWTWHRSEGTGDLERACPTCGSRLVIACAEALAAGTGSGDFDAYFDVIAGPDRLGDRVLLGGVMELMVGKREGSQVLLPGKLVSRQHCKLERVDFGPSVWAVRDCKSTNGLVVNGERTEFKKLEDGDVIGVGEYELRYGHVVEEAEVAPAPAKALGPGIVCPSCAKEYPAKSKICVACGVKLDSGRPILIASDADENYVHGTAETFIWWVSWLIMVTPLPMPLVSEAFGKHKPWAIRGIAGLTVVMSLIFLLMSFGNEEKANAWDGLMLWPPGEARSAEVRITPEQTKQLLKEMDSEDREALEEAKRTLRGQVPEKDLDRRALELILRSARGGRSETFHGYQLLTHAFLHDNGSVIGFILHLGGNMLFLLVFGGRINALLGNIATLILYPLLAVGAAGIYLWLGHPAGPMLGASGAVMGMAGMYLILFPVHRVYCGMWLRIWLRFRTWLFMKIFVMRGFWVLLMYFGYDAIMAWFDISTGTAHWAHIGGFATGALLALGLLASRLFNCGGGDLLSVTLGKYAWGMIGKPGRWNREVGVSGATT